VQAAGFSAEVRDAFLGEGGFAWLRRGEKRLPLTDREDMMKGMEISIRVKVVKLPEGLYLGTSEDVEGLVAQGRTVAETLEIARDLAKKILEIRQEWDGAEIVGEPAEQGPEYRVVVGL
jgi:predicted RNase H-like HicB family nuclease